MKYSFADYEKTLRPVVIDILYDSGTNKPLQTPTISSGKLLITRGEYSIGSETLSPSTRLLPGKEGWGVESNNFVKFDITDFILIIKCNIKFTITSY